MISICCNAEILCEDNTMVFICSNCLEECNAIVSIPKTQSASPLETESKTYISKQLLDLRSKLVMEFIKGKKTK